MSVKTPHYGLEAFSWGDYYSSKVDKDRFNIIDNELGFLSDLIGGGVIDGWNISVKDNNTREIRVSSGSGIIGKTVFESFGNLDFFINNNETVNIYMKRKNSESGGISGLSNIASVEASDNVPPSPPSNLRIPYGSDPLTDLMAYNQIVLTWDENSEVDFSHYIVKRLSTDGSGSYEILISDLNENVYIDEDLEQNTEYFYQVISVDLSGNESDGSNISVFTLLDERIPLPPTFFQIFPINEGLQVIWENSSSNNVEKYELTVQQISENNENVGDSIVFENIYPLKEFENQYLLIKDLVNNYRYNISIKAISINGIESDTIFQISSPKESNNSIEVTDIDISFSQGEFYNIDIESTLRWECSSDEYIGLPDEFLIYFIENGGRISEPITIRESDSLVQCETTNDINSVCFSYNIKFIPFNNGNGGIIYESLKEYTPYSIIIKTKKDEEVSSGTLFRINRTPTYNLLNSVVSLSIERSVPSNILIIKWENPEDQFFNYSKITIKIVDLSGGGDSFLTENLNIGKTNTYPINEEWFSSNYRYEVTVTPVDIFEREGTSSSVVQQFEDTSVLQRPSSPKNVRVVNGDGSIEVFWDPDISGNISSYNVYRSNFSLNYATKTFSLIQENVPSIYSSYIDHSVVNGQRYTYIVSAIDIYGKESINPITESFFQVSFAVGYPSSSSILSPVENLTATEFNSNDVVLSWDISAELCDGYEILRSIGNNYLFESIGTVSSSTLTYTDNDILLVDGETYYYAIRKFRNETSIFQTVTNIAPEESIFIGKITSYLNGSEQVIEIDVSSRVILKNLYSFIKDYVEEKISSHNHRLDVFGDRRIELRSNSTVSEWTTSNYKIYQTNIDISGSDSYVLRIEGDVNEEYFTSSTGERDVIAISRAKLGTSPILYDINSEEKTITFREPIFSFCYESDTTTSSCPKVPYLTNPILHLELVDISEVDNVLPENRIEDISAVQFNSGEIDIKQVSSISHSGRIGENLIPLKLPTQTLDNVVFSLLNKYKDEDRNKIGSSITFYDIIKSNEGDTLIAATSGGVLVSYDFGNNWNNVGNFSSPVKRIFLSKEKLIYAITNYDVFLNVGLNYNSWNKMKGLESVKIIRDITDDIYGNLYITTDQGVYRFNKSKPYLEQTWEKLSIFGSKSTEAYGIFYIEENDIILSSNELGILQSTNNGATWNYISDIDIPVKIFRFIREDDYIFALSNNSLWRKSLVSSDPDTLFEKISDIDSNICRNISIFNDVIYITTDNGAKFTGTQDIYNGSDIEFYSVWEFCQLDNKVICSLNLIEENLFIGTDKQLFLLNSSGKIWIQYEQINGVVPSIYKNGVVQTLGIYYNNSSNYNNICFDEMTNFSDIIEISNKYNIYFAEHGGWSSHKFNSKFKIWKNNLFFAESPENIEIDTGSFFNFTFPFYNDNSSNYETALYYQNLLQDRFNLISTNQIPLDIEISTFISDTYNIYEKFISQLYKDTRKIESTGDNGEIIVSDIEFPNISIALVTKKNILSAFGELEIEETYANGDINVSYGELVLLNSLSKFDKLKIDIYGSSILNTGDMSHTELEDVFEGVNSGLSSYLSQVSQSNLCHLNVFVEREWEDDRNDKSDLYQSKVIIPSNNSFYDAINSTINYDIKENVGDSYFYINYVSAIYFSLEIRKIIVGGENGILMISIDDLSISKNNNISIDSQIVKDIKKDKEVLYLLTNKKIFTSIDFGETWEEMDRTGLPNDLYSIGFISNNIIVGAKDGAYYKPETSLSWEKGLSSDSAVDNIINPDLLFLSYSNNIYYSANGFNFIKINVSLDENISNISKFGSSIYVTTKDKIYLDSSSFYGENPVLTEFVIDSYKDENIYFNDLYENGEELVIGMSNGGFYRINSYGIENNDFNEIKTIHKILIIDEDIWLFGNNVFKSPFSNYPIRLTTGVPL
ncbi:MAG: hypothetical protein WC942_05715 [Clostridia bacterium]|jgi:fibronectin type 3 domain-containing protein